MQHIIGWFRAHKILSALFFLVVCALGWITFSGPEAVPYETATVVRGVVVQEVSVTGRVEAVDSVDLAFDRSGRVRSTPARVGEHVRATEALVRLDTSELETLRAQAEANLRYELARLEEIVRGARSEEIAVSREKLVAAEDALSDARATLADKVLLAINAEDDAIYAKTDSLFENPRSAAPKFTISIPDAKTIAQIESMRLAIGEVFQRRHDSAPDPVANATVEKMNLELIRTYLDTLLIGISALSSSSAYSQTSIDAMKSDINLARTSVGNAFSALIAAEEKHRSADAAVRLAREELALKQAPPTPEAIAAQEAKIAAVRSSIENYNAQIAKMTLTAPFSGVITRQDAKLGAVVPANQPIVTLQSDEGFHIVAYVPEVDLAKVSVGDGARVTLDAYGDDAPFSAHVTTIDPAETIKEGVPTYKVTLSFDAPDERIRSGMTANIDILADERANVLKIPARAVATNAAGKYVRILSTEGPKDVAVEVGLRGSDGTVEIISGLTEGQGVITFEKQ